jgi:putative protease
MKPALYVLVRTLAQLDAVIAAPTDLRPAMVYCDFEDVRKYKEAVPLARAGNLPIALATLRIVKPTEEGFLRQVLEAEPDAIIVRNLAAISFYHATAPSMPLIGDHSLNIANELTARIMAEHNLLRMVPSYDLNWKQLDAMLQRSNASQFEAVIHQHMPMFHMEHCVPCFALSTGKDYRDCGRPCESHKLKLKDRQGVEHPLLVDAGCRNTIYNATAQTATEFLPRMLALGLRHFRIELLTQSGEEAITLLRTYRDALDGRPVKQVLRSLKVINQLGVSAGTFQHE